MKLKNVLLTLGLALGSGAVIGANIVSKAAEEPKETKADGIYSFYIDVTAAASWWGNDYSVIKLQTWNGQADVQYEGDWVTTSIFRVPNVDTTNWEGFKFVRVGNSGTHDFSKWSTDFSKTFFTHLGSDDNGTWDTPPAKVSTTVSVTFKDDVPSYIDMYLPGSYNDWSQDQVMTRVDDKTFTLDIETFPGTVLYKLVPNYHGSVFAWAHSIDSNNQQATISSDNQGQMVNIRSNVEYDFATNMPELYCDTNSTIQLTMSSKVDPYIGLYFVGDLTNWGKGASYLTDALMTPNEDRTVFTWQVPANTPVGTYWYKIVAMYQNGGQTTADYTHLVSSYYGNNASVEFGTEEKHELLSSSYDLGSLGGYSFECEFIKEMEAICGTTNAEWANNHAGTALNTTWSKFAGIYADLSEGAISQVCEATDDISIQVRSLYAHCIDRYDLTPWTDGPEVAERVRIAIVSETINGNEALIITVASITAIAAMAGFFFLRRRKEQ